MKGLIAHKVDFRTDRHQVSIVLHGAPDLGTPKFAPTLMYIVYAHHSSHPGWYTETAYCIGGTIQPDGSVADDTRRKHFAKNGSRMTQVPQWALDLIKEYRPKEAIVKL